MRILRIIHIITLVIEFTLELSDLTIMQSKHAMSHIFNKKRQLVFKLSKL